MSQESSRHVLDHWAHWTPEELATLSEVTQLKLERRRTYFLERLLKLGLVSPLRDYVCTVACPDPQTCARLVEAR